MNKSKSFLAFAGAAALSLASTFSQAEDSRPLSFLDRKPDVWLNAGFLSYHFDTDKHYRDFNYGVGAEAMFSANHGLMAGRYKNSESEWSNYVGYEYRPFHWQPSFVNGADVFAGFAVSLMDGYPSMNNKGWFIAPFPFVGIEGKTVGANFIFVPNIKHGAAIAMQLKLKVW